MCVHVSRLFYALHLHFALQTAALAVFIEPITERFSIGHVILIRIIIDQDQGGQFLAFLTIFFSFLIHILTFGSLLKNSAVFKLPNCLDSNSHNNADSLPSIILGFCFTIDSFNSCIILIHSWFDK